MNIYVTHELKQRMDAVEGRVNWSRIAQQAFESRVNQTESTKPKNIRRLRVTLVGVSPLILNRWNMPTTWCCFVKPNEEVQS